MQTLSDMAGNEISKKGLQGKIMVGINGSAWHSPGVDNYPAYNYTSLGTMALLDGKFLRNDYGNTGYKYPDIYYYGLDGNGDLQGYHSKKSNLQILYKSIVNAGVKDTFTFFNYPPIVINSKLFITDNGGKKASRTAFCQINNNNFVLFTTRSKMTIKQIATVLRDLHCKTAVNLDGGSSIGLVYKSRGSSGVEIIRYAKRRVADMLYVTE
jgi:exopolysaccharide biosynthesis protein